ncbi:hypothetical protein LZ318_14825 [Saccharopolyspora indica]|uniref:hypothetical protein n=1 Tax=Saccharopolyspora indica TaxID=1229659 RepID=UPI0022EB8C51|nr:hypothetical protein [Saccharopolyspora indica]MDA3649267.1 hypothetical protein [Saccharopolyspora indica]
MTGARWEPQQEQPERKSVAQRLWPVGLIADVAAVVTLVSGSTKVLVVVIAAVALLLGAVSLATTFGKPVGWRVVASVTGIVAGAVVITVVATQALTVPPNGQATGQHHAVDTPATEQPSPPSSAPVTTSAPPTGSTSADPAVKRQSGDKPIVLTSEYGLDLDSDDEPWIAEEPDGTTTRYDLVLNSGSLDARGDIASADAGATLDACMRAGYHDYVSTTQLEPGATFCVKTSSGTYARIVVRDFQDSAELTLDVLVWNKPN